MGVGGMGVGGMGVGEMGVGGWVAECQATMWAAATGCNTPTPSVVFVTHGWGSWWTFTLTVGSVVVLLI